MRRVLRAVAAWCVLRGAHRATLRALGVRSPTEELRKGWDPEVFRLAAAEVAPEVEVWREDVLSRVGITAADAEAGAALWGRMARDDSDAVWRQAVIAALERRAHERLVGDEPDLYSPAQRDAWEEPPCAACYQDGSRHPCHHRKGVR